VSPLQQLEETAQLQAIRPHIWESIKCIVSTRLRQQSQWMRKGTANWSSDFEHKLVDLLKGSGFVSRISVRILCCFRQQILRVPFMSQVFKAPAESRFRDIGLEWHRLTE
jgi:hypothetical protein